MKKYQHHLIIINLFYFFACESPISKNDKIGQILPCTLIFNKLDGQKHLMENLFSRDVFLASDS